VTVYNDFKPTIRFLHNYRYGCLWFKSRFSTNDKIDLDSKSRGLGLDLGLVYEWRPDYDASRSDINNPKNINKYKIRLEFRLLI
jgi:hypothetical protein